MTKKEILRLLCVNAYEHYRASLCAGPPSLTRRFEDLTHPKPGDLVMEISTFRRGSVPDWQRIGTLVEQPSPDRFVITLDFANGRVFTWENADFIKVSRELLNFHKSPTNQ